MSGVDLMTMCRPNPACQGLVKGEVSLGLTSVDTPAASSGQLTGVMK